jgi:hypothetical protein
MRISLLALMRGRDGRSLSRALAFLVLLNAVFGGLHAGMAAVAPDTATVLCHGAGTTDPTHLPAAPIPNSHADCCLTGCASAPAGNVMAALPEPLPPLAASSIRPPIATQSIPVHRVLAREGPRGPPVLA